MARKRYTEEQINGVLQEAEAGTKVAELCRRYGISEATYYNWKVPRNPLLTIWLTPSSD